MLTNRMILQRRIYHSSLQLVPFLLIVCVLVAGARAQQSSTFDVRTLSDPLMQRVANAREIALERKNIEVVRTLLRFAATFRDKPGSVSETLLARELLKVEERLGITQSETPFQVTAPLTPVFVPHQLHADVSYAGDVLRVNPQRTLDIYTPKEAIKAPVLVWVHGGGLTGGDKAHPGLTLIKPDFFLAHGFVFVSVNYRLMPDHVYPTFMNDAAQAVAWIHDNIGDFGGDPEKINLIGHSAGAHISSLLTTNQSFLESQNKTWGIIKSVISIDIASYDVARRLREMGPERKSTVYVKAYGDNERHWIEGSPARQIDSDEKLPPFLLLYAGNHHDAELMRTENKRFFKLLKNHGVTATLYEADDRTHETVNLKIGFRSDPASREIISFLGRLGMVQ